MKTYLRLAAVAAVLSVAHQIALANAYLPKNVQGYFQDLRGNNPNTACNLAKKGGYAILKDSVVLILTDDASPEDAESGGGFGVKTVNVQGAEVSGKALFAIDPVNSRTGSYRIQRKSKDLLTLWFSDEKRTIYLKRCPLNYKN